MSDGRYETLEHTADLLIRAYGKTIEESFSNAGFAMFDLLADMSNVEAKKTFKFEIESGDTEQLLVDYLSELLYIFDTKLVLLSEFNLKYDGEILFVEAKGESIDKSKHQMRQAIKAVSYHAIEVAPEKKGYVQVLFDA